VTSGQHAQFIRDKTQASKPGKIVTEDGKVVGTHPGIEGFTIGQRKGLGVAMGAPYFVTNIDAESAQITIGPHESLGRNWLVANESNWLDDAPLGQWFDADVQIRYNSSPQQARVKRLNEDSFLVGFDEPCFGVSPGQLAAVFLGTRAIGCGWINKTGRGDWNAQTADYSGSSSST